jgi:hypoxanthine phosphoribosyltransferase
VGVGDAFALKRLEVPPEGPRGRSGGRVREVGWAEFGELARALAERIGAEFQPEIVLGIVNGGTFLGGALATTFKAEFRSLRVRKFAGRSVADAVKGVRGKRVLVVDDVTASGQTLTAARNSVSRSGAADVRTGALVVRPARHHADFFALETDQLIVFGWDYQLQGDSGEPGDDPGEVGV